MFTVQRWFERISQLLFTPSLSRLHESARETHARSRQRRAPRSRVQPREMDAPECRDLPTPHWPSLPKLGPAAGGGATTRSARRWTQPAGIRGAATRRRIRTASRPARAHSRGIREFGHRTLARRPRGRGENALNRALRFHRPAPPPPSRIATWRSRLLPPSGSHCSPPRRQRRHTWRRTISRTAQPRARAWRRRCLGPLPAPSRCSHRRLRRVTRWRGADALDRAAEARAPLARAARATSASNLPLCPGQALRAVGDRRDAAAAFERSLTSILLTEWSTARNDEA